MINLYFYIALRRYLSLPLDFSGGQVGVIELVAYFQGAFLQAIPPWQG